MKAGLILLHIIVGIGALAGGYAGMADPVSPLGMTVGQIKNGPFDNYLIPGLFLFVVIGIGNLLGAFMLAVNSRHRGYISSIMGAVLIIFIIIQCMVLGMIYYLHTIFFFVGLIQAAMGMSILSKPRKIPCR